MSTTRSRRITAALLSCALSGGAAYAVTPVLVCTSCTTQSQLYADAYYRAIPNPQIPLYGYFLSVTQAPSYTYRQCYQKNYTYFYPQGYTVIINAMPITSCPDPGPPLS